MRGNIFDSIPDETSPEIRPRRWWAAVLLSILTPGLGHIYCGKPNRALFFYLMIYAVNVSCLTAMIDKPSYVTALFWPIALIAFVVALLLDAVGTALSAGGEYRLKRYNRPAVYIALFLCSSFVVYGIAYNVERAYIGGMYVARDQALSPTLNVNDIAVYESLSAGDEIKRGDLVVFKRDGLFSSNYVSRVVGLPGETLEMRGGRIFVNGKRLVEDGLPEASRSYNGFVPVHVGDGEYFLLGDNRHVWLGRPATGLVPRGKIRGRITGLAYAFKHIGEALAVDLSHSGRPVTRVRYEMY